MLRNLIVTFDIGDAKEDELILLRQVVLKYVTRAQPRNVGELFHERLQVVLLARNLLPPLFARGLGV